MKIVLILIMYSFFITGCENKSEIKNISDTLNIIDENRKIIKRIKFTGMYQKTDMVGIFKECVSGKKYIVADEGETNILDSIYSRTSEVKPAKEIFVQAEGFNSEKQNPKSKEFDTIIVITKLLSVDTSYTCEKYFKK